MPGDPTIAGGPRKVDGLAIPRTFVLFCTASFYNSSVKNTLLQDAASTGLLLVLKLDGVQEREHLPLCDLELTLCPPRQPLQGSSWGRRGRCVEDHLEEQTLEETLEGPSVSLAAYPSNCVRLAYSRRRGT